MAEQQVALQTEVVSEAERVPVGHYLEELNLKRTFTDKWKRKDWSLKGQRG